MRSLGNQLAGLGRTGIHDTQVCAFTPGSNESVIVFAGYRMARQINNDLLIRSDKALLRQLYIRGQIKMSVDLRQRIFIIPAPPFNILLAVLAVFGFSGAGVGTSDHKDMG